MLGIQTSGNNLRKFIIDWNNEFPWDYLWRRKYNVPFGSPQHLQMDFISMKFDLLEDKIYSRIINEKLRERKHPPHPRKLLKPVKQVLNNKETDEDFDDLNLSDFDEKDEDIII